MIFTFTCISLLLLILIRLGIIYFDYFKIDKIKNNLIRPSKPQYNTLEYSDHELS